MVQYRPVNKKSWTEKLLASGSVTIHLDPRVEGVEVPWHLRNQAQLLLEFGYTCGVPIPNLRVDDAGIAGTLFWRELGSKFAFVPWRAVFMVVPSFSDKGGMVWPESMPAEIVEKVVEETKRLQEKKQPLLRLV